MTVAQKILFVVSLPVLLCIVIGALAVRHQMNLVRDIQQTALDASATPFASEVVHHLQRERGFTAGFLASRRSGFAEKKDEQRLLTDAAVDKLAAFVQAVPAGFNPDTLESLNKALVMVEEVRALRAQIDENRRVTVAEMAQAYSEVIHHILTGINTSKRVGEIAELQIALREIQQAKEKAGQERAMGSNGLASGSFRPEIYDRFQRLAAQQEIYFAEFFEFAPDRHADALKAAVESETFKRVGEIRQIITKGAFLGNFNGITGLDWFEASSARIELLMDLEKVIVADISTVAVRKVAVARNTAILEVLGLILAVSFFFGVSLFFSSRAIARPARALAVICKDLASGKKIEIPYRDRRDEIGEMARGMDQVVATSQARKRVRAALRNTSAQLMLVSRGHLKYVNPALVATLVDASDDPGMTEKLDDEARLENLPALSKAISECHLVDGRGEVKGFEMSGRRFDLMVAVAMDEDGEDLGIVIEWRDITERRAIEEQLDKVLSAATNGEFSQRVTVQTSDALLASMANGMNAVFDSVEAFVSDLGAAAQALADGDLTRSIEGKYSGQLGVAAQAVTTSVGNLKDLIEAIKQAGEQLDGKSSDLGRNARQLSERTATQAAELEQTNATMNEISRAVTQNAQNTNQADALVNETHDLVSTCLGTMDDAVAAILRIEQGSNAISEIITIIQSIAFQTNLLSLNAAVEAARAGQAGAGFAVVAAEVRALAQRSSDAAKDIDQRIGASVVDVKSGVDLVGQAESSLVSMKEAVDKTVEMIGTINRSNKEQADSIREIQTAITGIDSITQANAEIAAQTAADANEISSNSAGLMGHTGRFQTTRGQSLRRSA